MGIIGLIAVSGSGTPSPIMDFFFQNEASTQGKELFGDIRHQLPSPSFSFPASVFRHPSSAESQINKSRFTHNRQQTTHNKQIPIHQYQSAWYFSSPK